MSLTKAPKHEHAWSSWIWSEGRGMYFRKCQHTKCCVCQLSEDLVPKEGKLACMTIIAKEDQK